MDFARFIEVEETALREAYEAGAALRLEALRSEIAGRVEDVRRSSDASLGHCKGTWSTLVADATAYLARAERPSQVWPAAVERAAPVVACAQSTDGESLAEAVARAAGERNATTQLALEAAADDGFLEAAQAIYKTVHSGSAALVSIGHELDLDPAGQLEKLRANLEKGEAPPGSGRELAGDVVSDRYQAAARYFVRCSPRVDEDGERDCARRARALVAYNRDEIKLFRKRWIEELGRDPLEVPATRLSLTTLFSMFSLGVVPSAKAAGELRPRPEGFQLDSIRRTLVWLLDPPTVRPLEANAVPTPEALLADLGRALEEWRGALVNDADAVAGRVRREIGVAAPELESRLARLLYGAYRHDRRAADRAASKWSAMQAKRRRRGETAPAGDDAPAEQAVRQHLLRSSRARLRRAVGEARSALSMLSASDVLEAIEFRRRRCALFEAVDADGAKLAEALHGKLVEWESAARETIDETGRKLGNEVAELAVVEQVLDIWLSRRQQSAHSVYTWVSSELEKRGRHGLDTADRRIDAARGRALREFAALGCATLVVRESGKTAYVRDPLLAFIDFDDLAKLDEQGPG